jgi:hypothetical protein
MATIAKRTRVRHPKHGRGVVLGQGVVYGTVLVHYAKHPAGTCKVARVRDLRRLP